MPPRKKIVKKTVKAASKTPTPVTKSPDSTPPDVNSTPTGVDGQCAAAEGSLVAQISLPKDGGAEAITTNDGKPEMNTPSVDNSKETLADITEAVATDREDPAGGTPMAVDGGETLAAEKSPTALSQQHSTTDAFSSGVAVTTTGGVNTAQDALGAKPSDLKSGIPPKKKIVKKVVKIVRKVPIKKTPATESPGNRHEESTGAPIPLPKDGDAEAITAKDNKPETEIPTLDSSNLALPDITVTSAADLEAPAVDITPMAVDTDVTTTVSDKSPRVPPQEPSSSDALCLAEAAATSMAGNDTPLVAAELKPDSKPAAKGKKIVVRKVKKVVKSGKSPASGKSPDVPSAETPAVPVPEVIVAGETPAALPQDPSTTDALSLDTTALESPAFPLITPSAVSEPDASSKPSGTGKKVVVRKVKKMVKRVVKVVKKGGEVKKVEEEGATEKGEEHLDKSTVDITPEEEQRADVDDAHEEVTDGNNQEQYVPLGGSGSSAMSLRRQRRKSEVFVGGLERGAKEDDVRKVFGKAGEIVEVRIMMDGKTGKNKGYAFVRYATPTQAKRAVTEFAKVEVCGKVCGAAALEGDDRIFLGNIDKKWKKEDIMKLLEQIGIEKIDALTLPCDPSNATLNRGFAFLEFETNRDAQIAHKKLQKKNAFGKDMNVKVAWADPLNEPDEEDMQKVKSVFVEGIPSTWTEKTLKQYFEKYGEIERIVLASNMPSAKRKDFAFVNYATREAARCCINSFVKEEFIENGSKININVSLAKPIMKGKKTKGDTKSASQGTSKETTNPLQRNTKSNANSGKGPHTKGSQGNAAGAKPSTTAELLHVLREQASWKHGQMVHVGGPSVPGYSYATSGVKRHSSALESAAYPDPRGFPRPRVESAYPFGSPSVVPSGVMSTSLPYHQRPSAAYVPGVGSDVPKNIQSSYNAMPYGKHHSRYI